MLYKEKQQVDRDKGASAHQKSVVITAVGLIFTENVLKISQNRPIARDQ